MNDHTCNEQMYEISCSMFHCNSLINIQYMSAQTIKNVIQGKKSRYQCKDRIFSTENFPTSLQSGISLFAQLGQDQPLTMAFSAPLSGFRNGEMEITCKIRRHANILARAFNAWLQCSRRC